MEWIKTVDQIPRDEEQVLVWYHGCELLVWNDTYKCWDTADGDDFFCKKDQIDYWMRLPENPYDRRS